jgi:hypothetical protein
MPVKRRRDEDEKRTRGEGERERMLSIKFPELKAGTIHSTFKIQHSKLFHPPLTK